MAAHRVGRQLPVVQGSGYALHTPIGGLEMLLKRATALFLVFLFACSGLFSGLAFAAGEDTETIRVGWPIQKGISEIDENGNYTGYNYEYLEEIAQYTGWNYEFVQLDGDINDVLSQMLEMLKTGELDLMGNIGYSDELAKVYDFAGQSYGTAYTVLSVLYENTSLSQDNYQDMQGIRVAIIKGAKTRKAELDQFCSVNQIEYIPVYCETAEEMLNLLKSGKADAMLHVDLDYYDGLRPIAKFSPRPYYFATTKGNGAIVRQLDSAILSINQADPYFSTGLYETFFNTQQKKILLSDRDKKYIENAGKLRVGILTDSAPFQYADKKTGELKGIAPDLLSYISEKTGLRFQLIHVSSPEELQKLTQAGTIDVVATMEYDYKLARQMNVSLSKSYASAQYVMLQKESAEKPSGRRLAMRKDYNYDGEYLGEVIRFDNTEQCFDAVNNGDADYTYANSYTVQYYLNDPKYSNLKLIPQTYSPYEACIGIVRPNNKSLLNIMNKILLGIPEEDLQAIIYQNTTYRQEFTLMSLIEAYPVESMFIVVILAGLIIGCLLLILRSRTRLNRKIAMDIKKHYQLYELSNEHFFEYDLNNDSLFLSLRKDDAAGNREPNTTIPKYGKSMRNENKLSEEQKKKFLDIITTGKNGIEDMRLHMPDDTYRWMRITYRQITDDTGKLVYVIGKLTDIDEEYKEKNSLIEMAQKDGLTNVYNRATCKKMITQELSKLQPGQEAALLILDIDNFKSVNDEFGHYGGDIVLKEAAKLLPDVFGKINIVGRLGGDEFTVYVKDAGDRTLLEQDCDLLCAQMRQIRLPGSSKSFTVSVGVAIAAAGATYNELYKNADKALYKAKENGRDGYCITQGG